MYNVSMISNARIARFGSGGVIARSRSPMDNETLQRAAPSIFAGNKHESRSEKFTYIPTIDVIDGLRREGFQPFEVRQGGSRDVTKRGFTKHLIRMRREGDLQVGDSARELILLNAHDGTSSYRLMSGLFRMVCSNGLVVADGEAMDLRIPHKGDIVSQVIEGAFTVIAEGERIDQAVEGMRALTLNTGEQEAFAAAAAELRFDEGKAPVDARQINAPRRRDDVGTDMWRTFNRVQENLVQGGVSYIQRNEQGRAVARRETRPVNSIDTNVTLNRALWTLATRMQELKAA